MNTPITVTIHGRDFYRAVSKVALAASADETLPVLQKIQVIFRAGRAHLIATDRYRVHFQSVALESTNQAPEDGTCVFLPRDLPRDLKRFGWARATADTCAVLRWSNPDEVTISSTDEDAGEATFTTPPADFPAVAKLLEAALEKAETGKPADTVARPLRTSFLADLEKAARLGGHKHAPATVAMVPGNARQAVAILHDGSDFRALIMAVAMMNEDPSQREAEHKAARERIAALSA